MGEGNAATNDKISICMSIRSCPQSNSPATQHPPQSQHPTQTHIHQQPKSMETSQQQLHCPMCMERVPFMGEAALRSHLALVHYHCLPYPCTLCLGAVRFPSESDLCHHVECQHGVLEYRVGFQFTNAAMIGS